MSSVPPVAFVVNYRPAGSFLVEESAVGTAEVSGTEVLVPMRPIVGLRPTPNRVLRPSRLDTERLIEPSERDGLAMLLERQQRASDERDVQLWGKVEEARGACVATPRISIEQTAAGRARVVLGVGDSESVVDLPGELPSGTRVTKRER